MNMNPLTSLPTASLLARARSRARARARARASGFTLIELIVALVAGLLVGMAVVGLSKEATNTFHEDMRAAQAQFSVRTAIDRLRSDLSRAGFMGTPNIWGDPRLVTPDYVTKGLGAGTCPLNIKRLSGLRLFVGGSVQKANITGFPVPTVPGTDESNPYSANNNLTPDAIDISGNMNTVDAYTVQTTTASTCGAIKLLLAVENPPAYRLLRTSDAGTDAVDTIKRSFIPVTGQNFVVRLQDSSGHVQYLESCDAGVTGGVPFVDITSNVPLLTTGSGTGTGKSTAGGESGFFSGSQLNPVLTVRYKLAPPVAAYADLVTSVLSDGGADSRSDLYRFYINSAGVEVGTPELVAEYAVDLKFAFTVDDTASNAPNPPLLARTQVTYAFDDSSSNNANYGSNAGLAAARVGPQRIRSVRVRLATRTAFADRQALVSPPTWTPTDYTNLFRYCTTPSASPCGGYARVRTVITEVAMNNLATGAYP